MRVGFDARWYNDSGVGSYVAGLVPALIRGGCELVVYIDAKNPMPGLEAFATEIVPIRAGRYSLFASLEFQRRAKQDKLDLFHSPFYAAPRLACPVIVTVHDLIPFLFPIYPWLKQGLVQAGYRSAARRVAHIITDSQHTANDIQKILGVAPERITPVHLAASEIFHPCTAEGELQRLREKFGLSQPYVVVASARNWHTKNLEGALKALAMAGSESGVEFQTVAYGQPKGIEAVSDRELLQNVCRASYVEVEELAALFRHAHAFVMPSLYEGFGLPLVEAMACGCPVITSDRGSLPEVAGDGAQCFGPADITGMAAALSELLCGPQELAKRKADALKRAADFSWEKTAQATMTVYHQMQRQIPTP
ncbi:MAG TPA: glycosyltransferase family 1 protein [Candidatus Angelobacter sp.]